jgi:hypothetical protein
MSQEAPRGGHWPHVALVLAICAALSAWNPFAAPAGLVVGVGSALIGWRAAVREERRGRRIAVWAAALGCGAAAVSAIVIFLSARVLSSEQRGQALVPSRAPAVVERLLDEAQRRTRATRERAADELEQPTRPRATDGGLGQRGPPVDGGSP